MAKTIPGAEFKNAVKDLNAVLKENKETTVKIVGVKKEEVIEALSKKIVEYDDAGKTDQLPDSVINLYNKYFVNDEEDTDEVEEKPKKTQTKKETKTKKGTKTEKTEKKTTKTRKKSSGAGVVALAVEAYMEKGIKTTKEISKHLESKFPGRNIASTISNVVCVLNHVKK